MTNEKFAKNNLWIKIIAIIGVITSIKLCIIYYNANFLSNAAPSFCSISEFIDCDGVAKTPYALFLGVPLALYGLGYYLFVLFLGFSEKLKNFKLTAFAEVFKRPVSYIASLSIISVVVSLVMACISDFAIHKICILCFFSYFLNILIFALSRQGMNYFDHIKNSFADFFDAIKQVKYAVSAAVVFVIAVAFMVYVNQVNLFMPQSSLGNEFDRASLSSDAFNVTGNILGDKDATVFVHEYTDYQCPYCAMSNVLMLRLVSEVGNVMVIHHNFPLDKKCNPLLKNNVHPGSCLYAQYGEASKLQNKFWDFTSKVFDDNKDLNEAKILKIAKSVGLDTEQLKKDANDPAIKASLQSDIKDAIGIGVQATPTYRVGVKVYEGLMPYNELKNIVIQSGGKPKN